MKNKILVCIFAFLGILVFGQEKGVKLACPRNKERVKPLIIIDEKVSNLDNLHILGDDLIENITILKKEKAESLYGSQGSAGVILVKRQNIKSFAKKSKKPLVIIDGMVSDLQKLYLLEEDKIQSINIIERIGDLLPTANVGDIGMIVVVTKNREKVKKRSQKITYLINDKEYGEEDINKIDPKRIQSVHILKDEVSKQIFNDKQNMKVAITLKD